MQAVSKLINTCPHKIIYNSFTLLSFLVFLSVVARADKQSEKLPFETVTYFTVTISKATQNSASLFFFLSSVHVTRLQLHTRLFIDQ